MNLWISAFQLNLHCVCLSPSFQFVCVALAINCVLAAHLGNTYIPPPSHASTAGGSTFLQTPSHGGGAFGSQFASSNQYSTSGNGAGAHFGFSGQQQQQQHHQQQQGSYQQGGQTQNYHQNNQYQQQSSGQQIPIIRFENQPNAGDGSFSYS